MRISVHGLATIVGWGPQPLPKLPSLKLIMSDGQRLFGLYSSVSFRLVHLSYFMTSLIAHLIIRQSNCAPSPPIPTLPYLDWKLGSVPLETLDQLKVKYNVL